MNDCSKCDEKPATRALVIPKIDKMPQLEEKNNNGVRIVRLCDGCWSEVEELLPAA